MKREKLIELRNAKNATHEDVAEGAGISRSHYGLIENGIRNPSLDVARRIAEFFNCSIEEVFPDIIFFGGRCYETKQDRQNTSEKNEKTA